MLLMKDLILKKALRLKKSGVKIRHYVENETQVDMAVYATKKRLKS